MNMQDSFKELVKILSEKNQREQQYHRVGLSDYECYQLYTYNWMAAKVVDVPVEDALKNGREITIQETDKKRQIEEVYKKFKLNEVVQSVVSWSRVYGSSFLLILTEANQSEPLDLRQGQLKALIPLDKQFVIPLEPNYNVLSPDFGKSEYYQITEGTENVHHSRILQLNNGVLSANDIREKGGYGRSIYEKLYDPIMNASEIIDAIRVLVKEASVDVYKVKDLHMMLSQGQQGIIAERFQIANQIKGLTNALVLDEEDSYEKKTYQFSGLSDIDDRAIQKLSGASGIPVTRLVGISPAGLNSTGLGDANNYYDIVRAVQELKARQVYEFIDLALCKHMFGEDNSFKFNFHPLKHLTEAEQTEVEHKRALTDQMYAALGLIEDTDILSRLADKKTYASITPDVVEQRQKEGVEREKMISKLIKNEEDKDINLVDIEDVE
ncbi:MAG: phage-associated protein, HI1409 family [Candidatus Magnetoglobus multicellularis str. Araruama]|uniref:Phage-associated protein, HI1409 family n=1 Tax=Candidatus Magnetoglobus multicellularis str. Araruama TaxID=890399 RepID=A0A1V1PDU1_9BACT|nr:MAG: phage-associated protein, HI1409 family [Candidatus Magnetoglobus multicellularis str. Araruama]